MDPDTFKGQRQRHSDIEGLYLAKKPDLGHGLVLITTRTLLVTSSESRRHIRVVLERDLEGQVQSHLILNDCRSVHHPCMYRWLIKWELHVIYKRICGSAGFSTVAKVPLVTYLAGTGIKRCSFFVCSAPLTRSTLLSSQFAIKMYI